MGEIAVAQLDAAIDALIKAGLRDVRRPRRTRQACHRAHAGDEALAFTPGEIEERDFVETTFAGQTVRIDWEPALAAPRLTAATASGSSASASARSMQPRNPPSSRLTVMSGCSARLRLPRGPVTVTFRPSMVTSTRIGVPLGDASAALRSRFHTT